MAERPSKYLLDQVEANGVDGVIETYVQRHGHDHAPNFKGFTNNMDQHKKWNETRKRLAAKLATRSQRLEATSSQ